ncbi:hypothetical protein Ahy_B08g090765 [Arachis hypogaea]|uniref:Leucine-rich repeat-containing N-terminal plant-type domain-containing protein n=1 Tax=Arachis hypogaea TaxID=3818 RepID=A0A444Y0K6_ARAHY|nr:hypothetical protein Ahy_B08g090765 [Arachis hypogaea]
MCEWVGVVCGYFPATNSRYLEKIQLNSRRLNRTIPSDINKYVVNLCYLDLGNNSFSGHLPSFLNLSYLQSLYLSQNNFTSIPHDCFYGLENLELLDLSYNTNLSPLTFPTNLNTNSRLIVIILENTNLIGSLPDIFDSFPVLQTFSLSENNLTKVLPKSFSKLTKLIRLKLNHPKDNKLSDTIQFLSFMPQLFQVNLEGNSFEGSIPDLSNCKHLKYLFLANNRLTGVVLPFLGLLNKIYQVSLENNWLQGPLPLFNKVRTPKVNLASNEFCLDHSGPCDHRVTTLLQVVQEFHYPYLLAQSWRGNNPCETWNFITCDENGNIRTVNLTNSNLTGLISPSFKNLMDLCQLYLGENRLNGSIPESLTSLQQLKFLDVSNNNLSKNLPPFSTKIMVITTGNVFL